MVRQDRDLHGSIFALDIEVLRPGRLRQDAADKLHRLLFAFEQVIQMDPVLIQILFRNYAVDRRIIDSSKYHSTPLYYSQVLPSENDAEYPHHCIYLIVFTIIHPNRNFGNACPAGFRRAVTVLPSPRKNTRHRGNVPGCRVLFSRFFSFTAVLLFQTADQPLTCAITSSAKLSCLFSIPSPVSKRTNFLIFRAVPLALPTCSRYLPTDCLPSSAFT